MEEEYDTEGLEFDFEDFRYSDLDSLDVQDTWVSGSVDVGRIKIDSAWFE